MTAEEILYNHGGEKYKNLLEMLHLYFPDTENIYNISPSSYYSCDAVIKKLNQNMNQFTVLSLNCQSLGAKFDKLILFLNKLRQNNILISALCLQETWFGDDDRLSLFQIENYNCISKQKHCSEHGGLSIYLHHDYFFEYYNIFDNWEVWEGQFIKILNNNNTKNIILGNIYRPPKGMTDEVLQQFINELQSVLVDINKTKSIVIIAGDLINLLKMYDRHLFQEYFEMLISYNLIPILSLPTRVTDTSATLIDNIFINLNKDLYSSGIIITDISDHVPCFCKLKIKVDYIKPPKYIFFRKLNETNINKFKDELETKNIISLLDQNYNADS